MLSRFILATGREASGLGENARGTRRVRRGQMFKKMLKKLSKTKPQLRKVNGKVISVKGYTSKINRKTRKK